MAGSGEYTSLILGGTTHQFLFGAFGGSFYQHLVLTSYGIPVILQGNLILQGYYPVKTLSLNLLWNIVLKLSCSSCAGSFGVLEHKCTIKLYLFQEGESFKMVLLGLGAESRYHIGCDGAIRKYFESYLYAPDNSHEYTYDSSSPTQSCCPIVREDGYACRYCHTSP